MKIAGSLLWVGYSVVLARTLPQSDFGRLFYIINVVLLAGPICGVGFENSVLRHGSRYGIAGAVVLVVAIIGGYVAGIPSPLTDRGSVLPYAALAIAFYTVMCVHRDLLRSAGLLVASQMGVNITRAVVPLALSFVLYGLGRLSLETALGSYVAGLAVSLTFEFHRFARLGLPAADRSLNGLHLKVALRTWPGDIFNALLLRADVLIVGAILPIDIVAIYIVAQRLAIFVDFPLDAIRTSAGPALSRAFAQEPGGRFRHAAAEISGIYAGGGIVGALGVALIGMPALLLFGANYLQGYPVLLALVLARLAPVVLGPASIVMNLTDQEASFSLVNGLSVVFLCVAAAIGAETGAIGAAIGVCVSTWLSAAAMAVMIRRRHGLWIGLLSAEARAMLAPSAVLRTLLSFRRPLESPGAG
jgi:O-antigen/teichoic acid export membrane protein